MCATSTTMKCHANAGDQKSGAFASIDCYAGVAADLYAKAAAEAAIEARCGHWRDSRASADARAEILADVNAREFCDAVEEKRGLSKAAADGNAFTAAVSPSLPVRALAPPVVPVAVLAACLWAARHAWGLVMPGRGSQAWRRRRHS